jgi:Tol biopolymer transport system component
MGSPTTTRRRRIGAIAVGSALLTAVGAVPSQATYPGDEGAIVFPARGTSDASADLWSAAPGAGAATRLTNTDEPWELCPAVSADGRMLATCVVAGDATEIWTQGIDGSGARQLTHLGGWALFPDWNPRGNRIVFAWAQVPETDTALYVVHPRSGKILPLIVEEGYSLGDPTWSPDGSQVLYTRTKNALDDEGYPYPVAAQLWTVDVRTGVTTQLTGDEEPIKGFSSDWSPDGQRIVFEMGNDVWLMDADGSDQVNLTNTQDLIEWGVSFSPTGRRVAFTGQAEVDGKPQVQVINVDGTDRHLVAPDPDRRQLAPAWQPVTRRTH